LFMDYKGAFPNKMLRKHRQTYQEKILIEPHFHSDFRFRYFEADRVTGQKILRLVHIPQKPAKSLHEKLFSAKAASDDKLVSYKRNLPLHCCTEVISQPHHAISSLQHKSKVIAHLKDLVEKMCILDPEKRLSTKEALLHPFVFQSTVKK
jgi:hypothetical protein